MTNNGKQTGGLLPHFDSARRERVMNHDDHTTKLCFKPPTMTRNDPEPDRSLNSSPLLAASRAGQPQP